MSAAGPARLDDYREVAPKGVIDLLQRLAERLRGRRFLHVNASRFGSGSPEMLRRLVPLLQELGVDANWEVIVGDPEFYATVRALERALAGEEQAITQGVLSRYAEVAAANAARLSLDADLVMVHDLAPVPLARHRAAGRWVWRCHADLSRAFRRAWHFVEHELTGYDAVVFSLPKFAQRLRGLPTLIVHPSLDPLSDKHRELSRAEIHGVLDRLGVPRDRPILLQVAPYARSKDPLGVLRAYRLARKYAPCRLVLAGAGAADNPEGSAVINELREETKQDDEVHVLVLPPEAAHEINALQRAATIVVHKPLQEDFGLGVTEAMWKAKPVIASPAGGIPAQVVPEVTGYLVTSVEGAAFRMRQLLQNPDLMARLGGTAREYVRRNFLLTRHLGDYLALLASLTGK